MFKRLRWMTVGAGVGFGASFWVVRKVRRTVERFTPERVSADVTSAVRGLGDDVRGAVTEGRVAMREREAELRAELRWGAPDPLRPPPGPAGPMPPPGPAGPMPPGPPPAPAPGPPPAGRAGSRTSPRGQPTG